MAPKPRPGTHKPSPSWRTQPDSLQYQSARPLPLAIKEKTGWEPVNGSHPVRPGPVKATDVWISYVPRRADASYFPA